MREIGRTVMAKKEFTTEEATQIAGSLGIDLATGGIELEQFRMGLGVELEHGRVDPETKVTHDDPILGQDHPRTSSRDPGLLHAPREDGG
jgi:hypothetical protein